eukprot:7286132-Pyramimonas_sp.AAC.3
MGCLGLLGTGLCCPPDLLPLKGSDGDVAALTSLRLPASPLWSHAVIKAKLRLLLHCRPV